MPGTVIDSVHGDLLPDDFWLPGQWPHDEEGTKLSHEARTKDFLVAHEIPHVWQSERDKNYPWDFTATIDDIEVLIDCKGSKNYPGRYLFDYDHWQIRKPGLDYTRLYYLMNNWAVIAYWEAAAMEAQVQGYGGTKWVVDYTHTIRRPISILEWTKGT